MTKLRKTLENLIPETVGELWIGEILYGALCELIGIWFAADRQAYSIGILCGVILSLIAIYHMWWAIDRAFSMNEAKAGKFAGTQYGIRYALLIVLIAVLYVTGWGNAFAAFLAYVGMKISAYIQPFIHKILRRRENESGNSTHGQQQY